MRLLPLEDYDREQFIRDNQEAFNFGAMEEFGLRDVHFEEEGYVNRCGFRIVEFFPAAFVLWNPALKGHPVFGHSCLPSQCHWACVLACGLILFLP